MHEGDWSASVSGHGADPESCDPAPSGEGYSFGYERELTLPAIDGPAFREVAVAAFAEVGLEAKTVVYGEDGDRPEWNVIAEDDVVGRAVVTIRPGEDWAGEGSLRQLTGVGQESRSGSRHGSVASSV